VNAAALAEFELSEHVFFIFVNKAETLLTLLQSAAAVFDETES